MNLLNFVPKSLKHLLETSDPLMGPWLVSWTKLPSWIFFLHFLPEFPCVDGQVSPSVIGAKGGIRGAMRHAQGIVFSGPRSMAAGSRILRKQGQGAWEGFPDADPGGTRHAACRREAGQLATSSRGAVEGRGPPPLQRTLGQGSELRVGLSGPPRPLESG